MRDLRDTVDNSESRIISCWLRFKLDYQVLRDSNWLDEAIPVQVNLNSLNWEYQMHFLLVITEGICTADVGDTNGALNRTKLDWSLIFNFIDLLEAPSCIAQFTKMASKLAPFLLRRSAGFGRIAVRHQCRKITASASRPSTSLNVVGVATTPQSKALN